MTPCASARVFVCLRGSATANDIRNALGNAVSGISHSCGGASGIFPTSGNFVLAGSQTLIYADGVAENDETITCTITSVAPSGGNTQNFTIGTPSSVTVIIRGTDSAPSFGMGAVSAKTFTAGAAIEQFQVPAASGGNGGITYAASNLPDGLIFDATGTDMNGCPGTEAREVCGTPTTAAAAQTVTITATDADSNTMNTDRASLTFSATVNARPSLASNPTILTEDNLDGATLTVTLAGVAYAAGVTAASFELVTSPTIAGLSIGGVAGGAPGSATSTLTLAAGAGYGFDAASTLAVKVLAAAHSGSGDLTTGTLPVAPSAPPGVTVSRTSLSLDEDAGADNANQGTYTLVLDSAPTGCSGGVVVSAANGNPDVTPAPTALTFTAATWNTPQTVTVTAGQDDDGQDDRATIRHAIATACDAAGYPATLAVPSVRVTVADDDATRPAGLPDPALRGAVARALGKAGAALTEADLLALTSLGAAHAGVSSVAGLGAAANLRRLELGGNALTDAGGLANLRLLEHLDLSDNALADVAPLSGLARLETLLLSGNRVADLSPLRGLTGLRELYLDGNAVEDLAPLAGLSSLRDLSLSGNPVRGLWPLCAARDLKRLWLAGAGLVDVSALSCLAGLERLGLADNAVADVAPLRGMRALQWLDLERNAVADAGPLRRLRALTRLRLGSNRVADAAPLAENAGLGAGDVVGLRGNPLSRASIRRRVPELRARGVAVLAGLPSPWFAAAGDAAGRRSLLRLVNRSEVAGEALVWGVDDAGVRFGPARLSIGAGRTARLDAEDLEFGNAAKGLADGLGAPTAGGWRLEVLSTLDLEAQTFLRPAEGPPAALHDALPRVGATLRAAFLPAGRERSPAGVLRVSNPGGRDETAYAWGVDDAGRGRLATGLVVPAGRAVTVAAAELERWRLGSGRGLGRGAGNWRLELTTPWPLEAQALAVGDGGRTGNLSGPAAALGPGVVARVPLFPPASAAGRVGVARVWNPGAAAGEVLVAAVDDAGVRAGPVVLRAPAFATAEFDSRDLEEGGGPLARGVGSPTRGAWRLELRADFDGGMYAYARGGGGHAASLLDAAPSSNGLARVSMFPPGSERARRGLLRLVNDGAEDATAVIEGVDDAGRAGGQVRVAVPAGEALWLSAAELESGGAGFEGSLGDGEGGWRLTVSSDAPLAAMSLVEDERGALGNLSTPGPR